MQTLIKDRMEYMLVIFFQPASMNVVVEQKIFL